MKRLFLSMSLAGLLACSSEPETTSAPAPVEPVKVTVETVTLTEASSEIELVGSVAARTRAVVSTKVPGRIVRIHAEEGQFLRAGTNLVELDRGELQAAVDASEAARLEAETAVAAAKQEIAAAEARRDLAAATHDRYMQLVEKESASQQEYDEAAAGLRTAEAAVALGQARRAQAEAAVAAAAAVVKQQSIRRDEAVIQAPVSGIVTARLADPGTMAMPGSALLEIEPAAGYRLEAAAPEAYASELRVGRELRVEIPALGDSAPEKARIIEIVPVVDPVSRTFTVKLALPPSPALRSGLFGKAFIDGVTVERLTVPQSSVVERGQVRSVFVADAGRAQRRLVSLGELRGERYEVLSGLDAGEQVLIDPTAVQDGAPVDIEERR